MENNKHDRSKKKNKRTNRTNNTLQQRDGLSPVGADNGWNDFRATFGKLLDDFPKSIPINFYYSEIRRENRIHLGR